MKKSVCVFCGASNNVSGDYIEEARKVGKLIADNGYHMVFGAGDCGLMGATANAALENDGTVTGVFPRVLDGLEREHIGLTELITVDDMHTRKMTMFNKSDAFIILPGGFGTMDETFEVITWKQLHTHDKPIVLYNYKGYWDNWIKLTEQFMDLGFAGQKTRRLYDIVDNIEDIFTKL
ncbi:MAG: TIGR00730 family Rossman fold protein [Rickettsiales bacterium]|nr:TIGR00730 family Rossman fold protein [Pseudomonadota bacterium]MDA0965715.1 TIGR00730 family Rossman fold protein [Pseudomonadota bacterium]MDG4543823.1 TIGR00730 family Rossman fold protein [Rickettsiales bacterium]MDG4545970.1 TIGR00730 family Rossman fold protein [Rickettsiales bacterium]MDG4548216.1 TIGR00730 family Rossman fold protein [Rickettsiales bacterium]